MLLSSALGQGPTVGDGKETEEGNGHERTPNTQIRSPLPQIKGFSLHASPLVGSVTSLLIRCHVDDVEMMINVPGAPLPSPLRKHLMLQLEKTLDMVEPFAFRLREVESIPVPRLRWTYLRVLGLSLKCYQRSFRRPNRATRQAVCNMHPSNQAKQLYDLFGSTPCATTFRLGRTSQYSPASCDC